MTTKGTAVLPTARRGGPSTLFVLLNGLKASHAAVKIHIAKEPPRRKK